MSGTQNIRVAIIDDDESITRSLGRLLRISGIQTVTYSSAESFLTDANHPHFDCIVLDILLGGMSGIELNQRLKAEGNPVPVIFNTAHDELEFRRRALQVGCDAYLLKTEPGEALLAAIHQVVQSAGTHRPPELPNNTHPTQES